MAAVLTSLGVALLVMLPVLEFPPYPFGTARASAREPKARRT